MEQLSLWEKIQVLGSNIAEHPFFLIILLVPAVILFLKNKHGKKAFVLVYLFILGFVLFVGGDVIFDLFDNMMDGLFMTLYFPNFITLLIVAFLSAIIALFAFFSKKMYKINKIINISGFAIVQTIFCLILAFVRVNNVDIYEDNALYANSDLLTLMQLLIGAFTLQIVAILVINGINKITDILDGKNKHGYLEEAAIKARRIKQIKLDNNKVGYINVKDSEKKTKLKPFKFDVDKLESIKLNVNEKPIVEEKTVSTDMEIVKPALIEDNLPPVFKPDLMKPMEDPDKKEYKPRFVKPENIKEEPKEKIKEEVKETTIFEKDIVDNLNIVNIQATLDSLIKYKLYMVQIQTYTEPHMAITNLKVVNYDLIFKSLKKYKLIKNNSFN